MKALNVKIALLTCVGFTAGMCWLVSRVSGPATTGAATLGAARNASTVASNTGASAASSRGSSDALRRASPIDTVRREGRAAPEIAVARSPKLSDETLDSMLPPVSVPVPVPVGPTARDGATLASYLTPSAPVRGSEFALAEAEMANNGALVATTRSSPFESAEPTATEPAGPDPPDTPAPLTHVVARGESVATIAKKTLGRADPATMRAIVALNPKLKNRPNKLYVGETLTLPGAGATDVSTIVVAVPKPDKASTRARATKSERSARSPVVTSASKPESKRAQSKPAAKPGTTTKWYTVKRNDSLPGIAKRLLKDERRWREIQALNGLKPGQKVTPGTKIKVPASRDA